MGRRALGLAAAGLVAAALAACDRPPKGPPEPPNASEAFNGVPEAVPFVEPEVNETETNLATPPADTATAAEPAPGEPAAPAVAPTAAPAPFGDPQDAIAADRLLSARQKRLDALAENAAARDATGEARADYAEALIERDGCGSRACLDAWYAREEAALSKWDGAAEILAEPLR